MSPPATLRVWFSATSAQLLHTKYHSEDCLPPFTVLSSMSLIFSKSWCKCIVFRSSICLSSCHRHSHSPPLLQVAHHGIMWSLYVDGRLRLTHHVLEQDDHSTAVVSSQCTMLLVWCSGSTSLAHRFGMFGSLGRAHREIVVASA